MSRICLDTSAYSHFMRGDATAAELIDRAEWVGLPAVVLGELRTGFLLGSRRRENEHRLLGFLSSPVVEIVDVDDEVSRQYAEIVVELRRAGRPIPSNDLWIAACALRAGALLLTYDGHFQAIARLGVLDLSNG
ncbi:MAG TPA: type II toxin-antitoxin system VapC family toxin [Thermoanaerobaculia bacterium]|nr:type II toxin-antitoxin system VapC family toxin [Thermoanaerobaculia bacterium]